MLKHDRPLVSARTPGTSHVSHVSLSVRDDPHFTEPHCAHIKRPILARISAVQNFFFYTAKCGPSLRIITNTRVTGSWSKQAAYRALIYSQGKCTLQQNEERTRSSQAFAGYRRRANQAAIKNVSVSVLVPQQGTSDEKRLRNASHWLSYKDSQLLAFLCSISHLDTL